MNTTLITALLLIGVASVRAAEGPVDWADAFAKAISRTVEAPTSEAIAVKPLRSKADLALLVQSSSCIGSSGSGSMSRGCRKKADSLRNAGLSFEEYLGWTQNRPPFAQSVGGFLVAGARYWIPSSEPKSAYQLEVHGWLSPASIGDGSRFLDRWSGYNGRLAGRPQVNVIDWLPGKRAFLRHHFHGIQSEFKDLDGDQVPEVEVHYEITPEAYGLPLGWRVYWRWEAGRWQDRSAEVVAKGHREWLKDLDETVERRVESSRSRNNKEQLQLDQNVGRAWRRYVEQHLGLE